MKLCKFSVGTGSAPGLIQDDVILDLGAAGVPSLTAILERPEALVTAQNLAKLDLPRYALRDARLVAPVDRQEVWAAGVTYLRSKKARMEESDFSASAYDRVYAADRPEIFFKSQPDKVVSPGGEVGIRSDANWNVPEPELALVVNSRGELAGFTIGNDMSSRDIEGENVLYLPQAKIYNKSCALGPVITLATEEEARTWTIKLEIKRASAVVFTGETTVAQIKRSFTELVGYLFRSQIFPQGAILLTGTGIVPPDQFTLAAGDAVKIEISGIGILANSVVVV